jgi:hypothetical protein
MDTAKEGVKTVTKRKVKMEEGGLQQKAEGMRGERKEELTEEMNEVRFSFL